MLINLMLYKREASGVLCPYKNSIVAVDMKMNQPFLVHIVFSV